MIQDVTNFLSKKDTEKVKGRLLSLRAEGVSSDVKDLVNELGISENILRGIEMSDEYANALMRRNAARQLGKEAQIFDAMVAKAVKGDLKAAELYFKLTNRLTNSVKVDKSGSNKEASLDGISDEELEIQFTKHAEDLDSTEDGLL